MDVTKEKYNPNPRDNSNIFSIIFLGYTIPIFKKGRKKTFDVEDLYNPLKNDRSTLLGDRLERQWNKQIKNAQENSNKSASLFRALLRTFRFEITILGILVGMAELAVKTSSPFLLGGVLQFYNPNTKTTKVEALLYATGIVATNFLGTILFNHYYMNGMHTGMRMKAALIVLIYRKSIKLSRTALGDTPAGKVVNLLSNDVSRFDMAPINCHQLWVGPISALIIMSYLYLEAGLSGVAGIAVIILLTPSQEQAYCGFIFRGILQNVEGFPAAIEEPQDIAYAGKLSAKFRKQTAAKTDERIRLMDEIICGIQIIKMYAWEIPFKKMIALIRKTETDIIRRKAYTEAFFTAIGMFITKLALFATLLTIYLSGQELTASKVFQLMAYFGILAETLQGILVTGVSQVAELLVSIRRLQEFLYNEEYDHSKLTGIQGSVMRKSEEIIVLKNLSVSWSKSKSDTVLHSLNMKVQAGKLIGIVGPVGSGKSSLLQTLLGELDIFNGTVNINGRLSYASQEPWVFASTIRQNIVFGAEYNERRYKEVIRVCALESDFDQFPKRDLTIIGDKGASLSGGQKARVNLARAVYRDLDIYLLDDPLFAVDIHVSKILYEECINGFLSNKTRILVTHQVHYLKNADHVIILKNGRIENEGTFNDLANGDNTFAQLFADESENKLGEDEKLNHEGKLTNLKSFKKGTISEVSALSTQGLFENTDGDLKEVSENNEEEEEIKFKDMQEESSKGKVFGSLILQYLSSGANCCNVSIVIFLYCFAEVVTSGTDWFISSWTNIEEYRSAKVLNATNGTNMPPKPLFSELTTHTCLYIYGTILFFLLLAQLFRSFSFYTLAMQCSIKLHNLTFQGVVNATMRFFDTNPSGRILNRISKDIGTIDEMLPRIFLDVGQMFLRVAGSVILVATVNAYIIILVALLSLIFWYLRYIYLKSSVNVKRVEGIVRSPAFTQLNATLQGLTTIRALRAEELLKKDFDQSQDYHTSAWFMYITTGTAYGFSLDMGCNFFVAIIIFSCVFLSDYFVFGGGSVGLALTQSSQLTGMVHYGMRQSAYLTNLLMSVERVLEYKGLTPDHQPQIPRTPPKIWPAEGEISFENTTLRYFEEGPTVLKNLNFTVRTNQKVGIVGRTGAGKSSLISALFKLVKIEGKIVIDGVDIGELSLKDLRSKITIIPQDPVLFSGTLRYNLDPFDEFTDEKLYKALNEVEFKDPQNVFNKLENRVLERGSNYSIGQRQLICLARAIIRNNKILLLDEATANVDPQTDALIQKTIRKKFANCTVLTVAHRLNTIMDSDKVLIMEAGQAVEFDHPHLLLQNKDGLFYEMVAGAGDTVAEQLRKIARESYSNQINLVE